MALFIRLTGSLVACLAIALPLSGYFLFTLSSRSVIARGGSSPSRRRSHWFIDWFQVLKPECVSERVPFPEHVHGQLVRTAV